MIAERISRWLGGATIAGNYLPTDAEREAHNQEVDRKLLDIRIEALVDHKLSALETEVSELQKYVLNLNRKVEDLDRLNGIVAGEQRTGNDTTPICESIGDGTLLKVIEGVSFVGLLTAAQKDELIGVIMERQYRDRFMKAWADGGTPGVIEEKHNV